MGEKVSLAGKNKDDKEKEPIKVGPTTDKDGGVFHGKIIAIVNKIKNRLRRR